VNYGVESYVALQSSSVLQVVPMRDASVIHGRQEQWQPRSVKFILGTLADEQDKEGLFLMRTNVVCVVMVSFDWM
jgi:hypothetical protein